MQTSGIKIELDSKNLLLENSEKIQKVITFAVKQAVLPNKPKAKPKNSKKPAK
jgi:hypothetical protein